MRTSVWIFRFAFGLSIILAFYKQEVEMFIVALLMLVCTVIAEKYK